MVVGLGMDVVVIFDINEYGVLLLDRIKKGLSKAFGYQKVGTGWRNGGIVWGYTSDDDSRADNQKLLFGQDEKQKITKLVSWMNLSIIKV